MCICFMHQSNETTTKAAIVRTVQWSGGKMAANQNDNALSRGPRKIWRTEIVCTVEKFLQVIYPLPPSPFPLSYPFPLECPGRKVKSGLTSTSSAQHFVQLGSLHFWVPHTHTILEGGASLLWCSRFVICRRFNLRNA